MSTVNVSSTVILDTFGNGLFTDFAPLLTLFGDEATKQFLATSVGAADTLLLSIGPLGLMTIVVSAIRVGGGRLLKSIIGRARDDPDDEEKEVLSSTSWNVREVWNGNRVIRQKGESKLTALLLDRDQLRNPDNRFGTNTCLRPLYDSTDSTYITPEFRIVYDSRGGEKWQPDPTRTSLEFAISEVSPNLTLNTEGGMHKKTTVAAWAFVGVVVQAAVMAIGGLLVFKWRLQRANSFPPLVGYLLWSVGTISMSLGTFLCGSILEKSCRKLALRPKKRSSNQKDVPKLDPVHVVFLQEAMPEQNIPTYAIESLKAGSDIQASERLFPPTSKDSLEHQFRQHQTKLRRYFTTIGVVLAVGGFVAQNTGTRELHWVISLLQLFVTAFVTCIRAWLRRKLGSAFEDPTIVTELTKRFESSHLATRLTGYTCHLAVVSCYPAFESSDHPILFSNRPAFKLPQIDKTDLFPLDREDRSMDAFISNVLNAQALLSHNDTDATELNQIATNCYQAMTAILNLLPGKDGTSRGFHTLNGLNRFIYVSVARNPLEDTRLENSHEMDDFHLLSQADIPGSKTMKDHINFLHAIIALTRYAYKDLSDNKPDGWNLYTSRIIGHCTSGHEKAQVTCLQAWLQVPDIQIHRSSSGEEARLTFQVNDDHLIFGLPFHHAFQANAPDTTKAANASDCELVLYNLHLGNHQQVVDQEIVVELMSSFMLMVATQLKDEFAHFLKADPNGKCKELTDVLEKHQVCTSDYKRRLAVVSALIQAGLLA